MHGRLQQGTFQGPSFSPVFHPVATVLHGAADGARSVVAAGPGGAQTGTGDPPIALSPDD